ncbi:hypothetical protein BGX30_001509 [Mortierella sp. GBA39]|nr:hypothetical protein BGX30_001509 [Mortierella sp. GBA39]
MQPSHQTAWESCTASTTPALSNTNWSRKPEVRLSTTTGKGIAAVSSNGFRRLMSLSKSMRVTAYDGGDQDMKMRMEMYDSRLETDEVEEEEEEVAVVEEKEEEEEEEESEGGDEDDDMIIDDIDEAFDRAAYVPSDGDEEDDDGVSIEDEKGESGEDDETEIEDEDKEEEESYWGMVAKQGSGKAVSETARAELKE